MTNLQIRLAVEIGRCGSVSTAAERLEISQPNASNSLRKLEEELDCVLFKRSRGGMVPTEQGRQFLLHAEKLLQEYTALQTVREYSRTARLRVGIMSYTPAFEAFIDFCRELGSAPDAELSCKTISIPNGFHLLHEGLMDAVVAFSARTGLPAIQGICEQEQFSLTVHHTLKACVRLRKGHPLLTEGLLDGSKESLTRLGAYPHVDYYQNNELLQNFRAQTNYSLPFRYRIFVEDRAARLRMVGQTNAYSLGVQLTEAQKEEYGLVDIPIESVEAVLFTVTREADRNSAAIRRYLSLLDERLK